MLFTRTPLLSNVSVKFSSHFTKGETDQSNLNLNHDDMIHEKALLSRGLARQRFTRFFSGPAPPRMSSPARADWMEIALNLLRNATANADDEKMNERFR
jgi:hypothetical protein